jgi:hypothetical protein
MRLYTIQTHPNYEIHTGQTKDNFQVLLGWYKNILLAILFDLEGNLVKVLEKPYLPSDKPVSLRDEHTLLRDALKSWLPEMIEKPGPIRVEKFSLNNRPIGIADFDKLDQEFLDDETQFPEEERQDMRDMIDEWIQRGDFVFWWVNDFWCGPDGFIHSS